MPCVFLTNVTLQLVVGYDFWAAVEAPNFPKYPECESCQYSTDLQTGWVKPDATIETDVIHFNAVNASSTVQTKTAKLLTTDTQFDLYVLGHSSFRILSSTPYLTQPPTPRYYLTSVKDPFGIVWCRNASVTTLSLPRPVIPEPPVSCGERKGLEFQNGIGKFVYPNISIKTGDKSILTVSFNGSRSPIVCSVTLFEVRTHVSTDIVRSICAHQLAWITVGAPFNITYKQIGSDEYRLFAAQITIGGIFPVFGITTALITVSSDNRITSCLSFNKTETEESPFSTQVTRAMVVIAAAVKTETAVVTIEWLKNLVPALPDARITLHSSTDVQFTCVWKVLLTKTARTITEAPETTSCPQRANVTLEGDGTLRIAFYALTYPFPTIYAGVHANAASQFARINFALPVPSTTLPTTTAVGKRTESEAVTVEHTETTSLTTPAQRNVTDNVSTPSVVSPEAPVTTPSVLASTTSPPTVTKDLTSVTKRTEDVSTHSSFDTTVSHRVTPPISQTPPMSTVLTSEVPTSPTTTASPSSPTGPDVATSPTEAVHDSPSTRAPMSTPGQLHSTEQSSRVTPTIVNGSQSPAVTTVSQGQENPSTQTGALVNSTTHSPKKDESTAASTAIRNTTPRSPPVTNLVESTPVTSTATHAPQTDTPGTSKSTTKLSPTRDTSETSMGSTWTQAGTSNPARPETSKTAKETTPVPGTHRPAKTVSTPSTTHPHKPLPPYSVFWDFFGSPLAAFLALAVLVIIVNIVFCTYVHNRRSQWTAIARIV